jgi:hypothetical protein
MAFSVTKQNYKDMEIFYFAILSVAEIFIAQVVDEYNVSTWHWCNTTDRIKAKYLEKSLSQC